jgi:catechol 2,3-dioxygenase-like lactoylglutathione lyase family enzyme
MLHHVSVGVRDVERALRFYDPVLGALGFKRVMEFLPFAVAYGENAPAFWVQLPHDTQPATVGNGVHIGFIATSRDAIVAFHAAALGAGGKDEGGPGPRPDYGPDYYGAFVRDPDGNKIEAVLTPRPAAPAKAKAPRKRAAPKRKRQPAAKKARGKKPVRRPAKAKRRR